MKPLSMRSWNGPLSMRSWDGPGWGTGLVLLSVHSARAGDILSRMVHPFGLEGCGDRGRRTGWLFFTLPLPKFEQNQEQLFLEIW